MQFEHCAPLDAPPPAANTRAMPAAALIRENRPQRRTRLRWRRSASGRRDYNYFRDYEPGTGRYNTPDPIGLMGGVSLYGYVGGNPMTQIDPEGLEGIGPWTFAPGPQRDAYYAAKRKKLCFDFDKFARFIEDNRFDLEATLATLGITFAAGTMPKTPAELRGLGVPRDQLNPYTGQPSRWAGRTGMRGLREFGRSVGGRALGVASLAGLIFEGFYDLSIEAQAGIHATYSSENCGCDNGR